ncbi:MAG: DUF4352 domain-containing protein, partial [Actinomycetes bacterium]
MYVACCTWPAKEPKAASTDGKVCMSHHQAAPPQAPGQAPQDYKNAKAEAKAAKAYAKAQRPWFKKKRFVLPLAIIAIIAVVSVSNAGGGSDTASTADASSKGASVPNDESQQDESNGDASMAGIGDKVRDGKFEFTVVSIKPGPKQIGGSDFGVKAQGRFVLVNITVKNIGDEPQSLFGDNQYLFIGDKKYSADSEAAIYLDDSKSLYEEINPGNALKGVVVFDLPKQGKPTKLELHDSAFSG